MYLSDPGDGAVQGQELGPLVGAVYLSDPGDGAVQGQELGPLVGRCI